VLRDLVSERFILCEHGREFGAERNACRTRQGCKVNDEIRLVLVGE
jgi:hypothetical protein